jgi:hypothetical protein
MATFRRLKNLPSESLMPQDLPAGRYIRDPGKTSVNERAWQSGIRFIKRLRLILILGRLCHEKPRPEPGLENALCG